MAAVTRAQIEATIHTLRKNAAQAAVWYGENDHRVGRIKEFLADSEQRLNEFDRRAKRVAITTQKEIA